MTTVERPLSDVVFELADADSSLDEHAKLTVLAALEGRQALRDHLDLAPTGRTAVTVLPTRSTAEPTGAFLTSISVAGFRGIGPTATLPLHPAPGLTVVSGRNGSGKSSLAEALEFAVTGGSYRWRKKSTQWTGNWRNLHQDSPCQVRIGLAVEDGEPSVLGVDWSPGANLDEATAWLQVGKGKRQPGWDGLGWRDTVEKHRPLLSYDEIGGLFEEGPSALYDALAKLLGLEEIYDAEKLLADELALRRTTRKSAADALKDLKLALASSDDSRAADAVLLLKKRIVDLDAVGQLASGTAARADATIGPLRKISTITVADAVEITAGVERLRHALAETERLAGTALELAEQRSKLLSGAIALFDSQGEGECPVCGEGRLTADWKQHATEELAGGQSVLGEIRSARAELDSSRRGLRSLTTGVVDVAPIGGVDLETLERYRNAVSAVAAISTDSDLTSQMEAKFAELRSAATELKDEAKRELADRENHWAPLSESLATWIGLERAARTADPAVAALTTAKKWVTEHAADLRNQRLAPLADQARKIWAELRQESNVDLGSITLTGTRTSRKAMLEASVDGQPAGALSVMSQGELHALALALFIPRATTPSSPFRFIVLDDPIQAMDPAKIDGFVKVLASLAKTRQVIVFSHDDRLAATIRQLSVDARLVEVTRGASSTVAVAETLNSAVRYARDAFALLADKHVPDDVKNRVAPGLFRLAIEAAARDTFYAKRYRAGVKRETVESEWENSKTTRKRIGLALTDVPGGAGWPEAQIYRRNALRICGSGVHSSTPLSTRDANDLRKTIADLQSIR
ncbi:AAA family ATPase [Antrihabitans stalactiti]|uniref:Nuclease SbcCD subunit C n=1 Tax=Antrihabitans stalactiti TaxID=2584121 RepID=A0A848KGF0_9NOCA|nr:AAA family ATPase [Antrihabitans stalactiti]NMN97845.1 recombinase RecF [Antrihabitans stalactiti]